MKDLSTYSYSLSGQRKGSNDKRHLWPYMFRGIRQIGPRWIVGENVRGVISWNNGMVLDEVQSDLEAEGYEVLPFILPACGIGAPHQRERVIFVAYSASRRCRQYESGRSHVFTEKTSARGSASNTADEGLEIGGQTGERKFPSQSRVLGDNGPEHLRSAIIAHTTGTGLQAITRDELGGVYKTDGTWPRSFLSGENTTNKKWRDFPTQSPVCSGDDGVPSGLVGITVPKHRNESIKGYGNAVVPQLVYQIYQAIAEYEILYT